jgi:hypothetical protein
MARCSTVRAMETTKKEARSVRTGEHAHELPSSGANSARGEECMSAPEDAQETLIPASTFALDALAQIRARAEAVADARPTHDGAAESKLGPCPSGRSRDS